MTSKLYVISDATIPLCAYSSGFASVRGFNGLGGPLLTVHNAKF